MYSLKRIVHSLVCARGKPYSIVIVWGLSSGSIHLLYLYELFSADFEPAIRGTCLLQRPLSCLGRRKMWWTRSFHNCGNYSNQSLYKAWCVLLFGWFLLLNIIIIIVILSWNSVWWTLVGLINNRKLHSIRYNPQSAICIHCILFIVPSRGKFQYELSSTQSLRV
jgi:hypothetical protein